MGSLPSQWKSFESLAFKAQFVSYVEIVAECSVEMPTISLQLYISYTLAGDGAHVPLRQVHRM